MSSVQYPTTYNSNSNTTATAGPGYTYSFDSMSRPTGLTDQNSITDVSGVTYNAANQMLGITYFGAPETRQYNSLGQMTQLWASSGVYYNYNYPTGGTNNGKISSSYEAFNGETLSYTYDSLNRLATAGGTSAAGNWAETYGYDSFGNLTAKTPTAGAPPSLSQAVNAANNQIVGQSYDANGNQVTAPGYSGSSTYDVENRLATAPGVQYAYDSQNKRVWAATVDGSNNLGSQTLNFYGVNGQLIGTYALSVIYGRVNPIADWPLSLAVYFGSKRIATISQGGVTSSYWQDRLGSNRNNASRYYPWGEDRGTPSNDQVRFATYTRDSATLLDYADQRYYGNAQGRFMTPDRYKASGHPSDPQSWNRYAYTRGDPTNRFDALGADDCAAQFADASQPYDPYSSCSGPAGNPCSAMIMDFQDDPDAVTFFAQAAAMGCASASAAEVPTSSAPPPCNTDIPKIDTTLTNLGQDILTITAQKDGAITPADLLALSATIGSDIESEMQNSLAFFNGGHFSLDLSGGSIESDLGGANSLAYLDFEQLFNPHSNGRRYRSPVPTTDPNNSYYLHDHADGDGNLSFHFDRFNPYPWYKLGSIPHGAVDFLWGNLGVHCLDPAWR